MSDRTEEPSDLSPAERAMWIAFRTGGIFDARADIQGRDHPPPAGFRVRAEVLTRLLVDGPPALPGRVASVKLRGLQITGSLDLSGLEVTTYVELIECNFEQPVLLEGTRMGTLRLVGCVLPGLKAERLQIAGDLHLPRCEFSNGLVLKNAHVGSNLLLSQAKFHPDRHGISLLADGLAVTQDVEAEQIESYGQISLADAQFGKSCSFRGSQLRNRHGRYVLTAPRLLVERSLYFSDVWVRPASRVVGVTSRPTVFEGGVQLDDARIGDAIDLEKASLRFDLPQEFSLRRVQTSELRFSPSEVSARVVLAEATVATLIDSVASWPAPGTGGLELAGFVYKRIAPREPFPLSERIRWLETATWDDYDPQPYEQLARVLRAGGAPQDADTVLLARMRRRRETLGGAAKVWDAVQDVTFGYGYRPGRAAIWLAVIWAIGSVWFTVRPPDPMKAGEGPSWSAPIFTLDLLLPILDLGQETQWHTEGISMWIAVVLAFAGWILATSVAVGAAAVLLRRN